MPLSSRTTPITSKVSSSNVYRISVSRSESMPYMMTSWMSVPSPAIAEPTHTEQVRAAMSPRAVVLVFMFSAFR